MASQSDLNAGKQNMEILLVLGIIFMIVLHVIISKHKH